MEQQPSNPLAVVGKWSTCGINVTTLRGVVPTTSWTSPIMTRGWGLTLAQRGAYRRRVDGHEHIVDASTGFVRSPAQEVSTSAFSADAEEFTRIEFTAPFLHHLPDLAASAGPIAVEPGVALAHRLLLRRLRDGVDVLDLEAAVFSLVHACLRRWPESDRRVGRRPATIAARRRLVTDVLELVNTSLAEPYGLIDLGRLVGASPYHLSRVFREVTGYTVSEYRTRLRVHAVLERLDQGADDLSGVAAATGFADHGHMTRTVSRHLGAAPSVLRERLAAS